MRPELRPLMAAALALFVAGCVLDTGANAPTIGEPAPAYAAVDLDGNEVSLAGLQDSVFLLNIWATWCPPCRDELPVLQALHEEHADRGFKVIGVSVDSPGEQERIRRFASEYGITYPLWHDPDERISTLFRAVGVPASYLIDGAGVLRWRRVGPVHAGDTELAAAITSSLENK
jgi:peroxiredoxin